jgi:hypothetical protein
VVTRAQPSAHDAVPGVSAKPAARTGCLIIAVGSGHVIQFDDPGRFARLAVVYNGANRDHLAWRG